MSEPPVSVIIPARDAALTLERTIEALRGQDLDPPFEVIVAAPGKAGALAAVNAAVEKARADKLVFLPSGLEPVAGWLDELLAAFGNFDGIAMAGAKVIEVNVEPTSVSGSDSHE